MFDYYEPNPTQICPRCGMPFEVWQGEEGPNALFVWRQGEPHPVDQPVDEECRIDASEYAHYLLPATFGSPVGARKVITSPPKAGA